MDFYKGLHPAQKWQMVKKLRAEKLSSSDWSVMPDSPLTEEKRQEFIQYREKLRDIPQNFDNPDDVVFPETPKI